MLCLKGRKAERSLFRDVSVIGGGEIESELEFASGCWCGGDEGKMSCL